MRRLVLPLLLTACSGGSSSTTPTVPVDPPREAKLEPAPSEPSPAHPWPATRTAPVSDVVQGAKVIDPYRWLEDEKAKEVQVWMSAQDSYARTELAKLPAKPQLVERLKQLFYFDAITSPVVRKGRFFYTRKHADKEKLVVYWKQGEAGVERVLFDPNTWSTDEAAGLGGWWPSADGKLVAYAKKLHNSDESTMFVYDLASGKDLATDVIEGTKYSGASWAPDGKGFYYTWLPPVSDKVSIAERPGFAEVRFHKVGTAPATDPIVHEATKSPQAFIGGTISHDGHWLVVAIQHGWNSSDLYFKNARTPAATWTTLVAGVDANVDVIAWRDRFYVTTNDGAPRNRVFEVDPRRPERAAWKQIVAQSDATIDGTGIVGGKLVLSYLRNATSEVEVHELDGTLVRKVALPPLGSSNGIGGNPDDDTGYFSYNAFTQPQVIYKTSIRTGKVTEWARVKLPIDTTTIEAEQVFYPSKDGTKISMFIIKPRGAKKTGKTPTILYGYGGFNVSLTPWFSSTSAAWIERGGIYAIPNLRGGGEYGEEWHRNGMLLAKQNVFDDFIGAAEFLIKDGWTTNDHLAISGASNGGLLVGAVMTQRPDLFKAVVCDVPLLDMLRYHLFGSGKTWIPEYGSADDAAQFKALYQYSPYRVAVDAGPRPYPALLLSSADHDDRVDPLHARKFAALIQHHQIAERPVLLRIERNAGHGGADTVRDQVDLAASQLAWLDAMLK